MPGGKWPRTAGWPLEGCISAKQADLIPTIPRVTGLAPSADRADVRVPPCMSMTIELYGS